MKNKTKNLHGLKIKSKKAQMAIGQIIKILTAIVLGATLIMGGLVIVEQMVLPTSKEKIVNMFNYKVQEGSGVNGSISDNIQSESTLNHSSSVPDGGTYNSKSGISYNANESMPTISNGDIYIYGDYKYTFDETLDGWSVLANDKRKSEYGAILEFINNKPIKSLYYTFSQCSSLTMAPTIPNTVTEMHSTFKQCASLSVAPTIPDSVTVLRDTFWGCSSLIAPPEIPEGVTEITNLFRECVLITEIAHIPNSVKTMNGTFRGCIALKKVPQNPDGVVSMMSAYYDCVSLTTVPNIPDGVTSLYTTFTNCSSLEGTIVININPQRYTNCFKGTVKPIILVGTSAYLNEIAATADNGNVTVG